jgi:hypothetical protein
LKIKFKRKFSPKELLLASFIRNLVGSVVGIICEGIKPLPDSGGK